MRREGGGLSREDTALVSAASPPLHPYGAIMVPAPLLLDTSRCTCDDRVANIVNLGIGFMFIYTGVVAMQNYMFNSISIADADSFMVVFYAFDVFGCFVAPAIVKRIGSRASLAFGSMWHILFLVAAVIAGPTLLLPTSVLAGVGGSLLWTAQGAVLVVCGSEENIGLLCGIFFCLFRMNLVVGSGLAAMLEAYVATDPLEFTVLLVTGAVGMAHLLLIGKRFIRRSLPNNKTTREDMTATLGVIQDVKFIHLGLLILFAGASASFFMATTLEMVPSHMSTYILITYGASEAVGAVMGGLVSDMVERRKVVVVSFFFHGIAMFLLWFASETRSSLCFATQTAFGLGDGILITQLYSIIFVTFDQRAVPALAACRMFLILGTIAANVCMTFVAFHASVVCLMILFIVAATLYFLCAPSEDGTVLFWWKHEPNPYAYVPDIGLPAKMMLETDEDQEEFITGPIVREFHSR